MIHERLKKFFEENGISQQQVADNLGVSLQYINAILKW
jgi:transcriptional regulator with XRE-family HTH domain